jgi:hypothetical protein
VHEVSVKVFDQAGNSAILRFWIKSEKPDGFVKVPVIPEADSIVFFKFNKVNKFETRDLTVELPAGSLYEDVFFRYRKSPGSAGMFSDIHYLHVADVPVHSKYKVAIKATALPEQVKSKALIIRIDSDGKRHPTGGTFENGYIITTTNLFDGFAIGIDTVSPVIKPWAENKKSKTNLKFTVSDNMSGIRMYRGEVNGHWALVEWDPKNKLMIYRIDQVTRDGENTFNLYLEDEKGNKSNYSTKFTR